MKRKRFYNNQMTQPYQPPRLQNTQQPRPPSMLHASPTLPNRHKFTPNYIPLRSQHNNSHQSQPLHHQAKRKQTGMPSTSNFSGIPNSTKPMVSRNQGNRNMKITVPNNSTKIEAISNNKREPIILDDSPVKDRTDSKRRKVIAVESDDDEISKSGTNLENDNGRASSSKLPSSDLVALDDVDNKTNNRLIPKKYSDHLTSAIYRHYEDNKQDQKLLDRKVFLRDGVQQLIGQSFGGEGLLHLTGSSMSGFGTKKSDADMALIFDPYISELGKKKSRNIIARIAGCLRRQAYCANVEMIFAKVPIVKFFDKISHCDVDININNIVGIKNSFLLRSISLVDSRIPALVIVIKQWAKSHDINSAFKGSLSSYCLVSMIIYFLQTGLSPPILPPLKSYVDNLEKVNVNTQLQHLVPKTFIKFDIRNKEELGDIFVKFFQFWVKKFRQNKIFSLYTAQESIRTYNQPFLDTSAYVLVIQEPFQKDNIARAVRGQQFDDVKSKFNKACDQFKDIASFDELFGDNI